MSDEPVVPLKAVLYTDGGYRMQYTSGGWGVHGYLFTNDVPKKGTGNAKAVPTHNGYSGTVTTGDPVTITTYVDGMGGVFEATSSNHTELEATTNALQWILEKGLDDTLIYTDSRYVVDGFATRFDKWKKNGFRNSEGNIIASKDLWIKGGDLRDQILGTGKSIRIEWIKGHEGHFGNEQADVYASIGNVLGRKKDDFTMMRESEPSGYWSQKHSYNRMLAAGRWYMQTTDYDFMTDTGQAIYYIGDHGKDDDFVGKPTADRSMAVLFLNEPDPVLEALRAQAMELDKRKFGSVLVGRLDNILNPSIYSEVAKLGTRFLDWDTRRLDIVTSKRKFLLKEASPPGQVYHSIDVSVSLERRLKEFLAKDNGVIVTEITDLIYDDEIKKKSSIKKLNPDIVQTTKHLTFDVRYSTKRVSELTGQDDESIKIRPIKLILGQDIAKRNTLANLGENSPKLYAITWRESDMAIRFATVIECDLGIGIWTSVDSNFLLV
jgi:ribonuclease HI